MQLQYAHLLDVFTSMVIIIGIFLLLLNFNRVLAVAEFFISLLIISVQNLYNRVTIKVNGGYDYGKKQGNFKRPRSGPKR